MKETKIIQWIEKEKTWHKKIIEERENRKEKETKKEKNVRDITTLMMTFLIPLKDLDNTNL
jgi:hypothetical protein